MGMSRQVWVRAVGFAVLCCAGLLALLRRRRPTEPIADPGAATGTGWSERYLDGSQEAEEKLFARFAEEIKQVQSQIKVRAKAPHVRHAFHAKSHAGITNAELRVRPDLPEDLRIGLFQPGAVYPATVRLSNASGAIQPDGQRDLRGIAVRVRVGEDRDQDFLMTNAPASHARDARQFMVASTAMASVSKPLTLL